MNFALKFNESNYWKLSLVEFKFKIISKKSENDQI